VHSEKAQARSRGLLVLVPDCGISLFIHRDGSGITHAIGTGSHLEPLRVKVRFCIPWNFN
jgi:hypothetical protein